MHPSKFMGRPAQSIAPAMSSSERLEQLSALGAVIAGKRKDAVEARKTSGIEDVWMAAEEAYLGIDDMNRHDFAAAKWAKPVTMNGGLTSQRRDSEDIRSNAFVRLTSRYVDYASAKLGEILLPIDDKAFSFEPVPESGLIKLLQNPKPVSGTDGQPVMQTPAPAVPGAPPEPPQAPAQATVATEAQAAIDRAKDSAKKAESRIADWLTESNYPTEARKVIHDSARIGVGVLKGPFPDIQESRALVRAKDGIGIEMKKSFKPSLCWVDPWNLFPDDACGEDIHNGDGLFERDYLSTKMLKRLKSQKGYLADQIDQVIEEGPGKCYAEGGNPNDKKSRKRYEIWYYYGLIKRSDMVLASAIGINKLPDSQEEVHAIISLVNDTVIRATINPLDSGCFPYRVMTWTRRPGHWAGVGVGEQISMPQRTCNAATRSMLNNAGVSSGVQFVINQLGIVPADGSYRITPNKIWYLTADATDIKSAFQVFEIPNVQERLMAIIEYAMKLAEESSGIPLVTQGQTGPTSPQTFGAAELQNDNANTWMRSIGYRYDGMVTEPLIDDFYEYLLLDPDVPDEEKGEFKISAQGSSAMVERAIQESVLLGLLQASANPAFKADPAKVFAQYLRAKRLDPRDIQYTPEEQAKMAQQPAPPPLPIAVEQLKGQNAVQVVQAKAQAELTISQQEMVHEQGLLQNGGASPHMAAASAKIEQERIRSETAKIVESSRASAEQARAQKEYEIAQQNGQFRIEELRLKREIAILEYTSKQNITVQQAQAELAQTAIQEKTKRELGAAEVELASAEGDRNREVDMHKHATSLVRDQMSTEVTP